MRGHLDPGKFRPKLDHGRQKYRLSAEVPAIDPKGSAPEPRAGIALAAHQTNPSGVEETSMPADAAPASRTADRAHSSASQDRREQRPLPCARRSDNKSARHLQGRLVSSPHDPKDPLPPPSLESSPAIFLPVQQTGGRDRHYSRNPNSRANFDLSGSTPLRVETYALFPGHISSGKEAWIYVRGHRTLSAEGLGRNEARESVLPWGTDLLASGQ